MPSPLRVTPDVAAAMAARRPIVALESSVLAQGLPVPHNREAAGRMTAAVREAGAVPAITAVVQGVPTLGLMEDELERFLRRDGVRKVSARDLPAAMVARADGATTVAASLAIAALGGIPVFATGGIGGVHRGLHADDAWVGDESADLLELARTPVLTVCAGAKSILDLPATMERLETLGVPVVGFGTDELPGFFTTGTGIPVPQRLDTVAEVAALWDAHRSLGRPSAVVVVQPPPTSAALPRDTVDAAVRQALESARADGIRGAAVTPFLLGAVLRATEGKSLAANLALLEANARLAGEIAVALSDPGTR